MDYSKKLIKGFGWMTLLRFSTRAVSYLRIAILARILTPNDFGVFAIATLVLSFLERISETGINVILIQSRDNIRKSLDTAWTLSIIRGILVSSLIFLSSSYVANFFNVTQGKNTVLLIFLVPLLKGFINPMIVTFQKSLEFRKEFLLRFVVFVFDSLICVLVAVIVKTPEAFVWGLVAGSILEVILSFLIFEEKPKISFKLTGLKTFLRKSKWVTGFNIINYIFENGDDAVVGKLLNSSSLGLYQAAYKIAILPLSEISSIFISVSFPAFSKIAKYKVTLKRNFNKSMKVISLIVIPLGFIIFIFSKEIVDIIFGAGWSEVIPLLKALSVFGVVRALTHPCYSVLLALKKQELVALGTFISLVFMGISIAPLVLKFGLIGAVMSVTLSSLLTAPIVYFVTMRQLNK